MFTTEIKMIISCVNTYVENHSFKSFSYFTMALFIFLLKYSCFIMCSFLLYSKVNQLYIYIYPLFWISFPFRSLESIEKSSLCYTVGSHQLPVLYIVVYIYGEGNGTPLQYSCLENPMGGGAWQAAVHGVTKSRTQLSDFTFTFHFHALEKEMATHSSVLAWRIPGTGEPGRLPSMGSHRVGRD